MVGIPVEVNPPAPTYEARPPSGLRASDWTYPLQVSVVAWLVASALVGVFTGLQAEDRIRSAVYATNAAGRPALTGDDPLRLAQAGFATFLVLVLAFALAKLAIAASAYRGRGAWTFFAVLGLTAIDGLLALVSLVMLGLDALGGRALGGTLVMLLVRTAAAALCGWMILALRRYGRPWALERVPET
jgi:hypothetical protein